MRVKKLVSFVFFVSCTMAVVISNLKSTVEKTVVHKKPNPSTGNGFLQASYKQTKHFPAALMAIQSK